LTILLKDHFDQTVYRNVTLLTDVLTLSQNTLFTNSKGNMSSKFSQNKMFCTVSSNASPIRVAPPVSSHEYSNASKFNPKSADFRCIFQQLITLLKRKIFKTFFFLWATAKVKVAVYPRISYKCCYFAKEFVG